MWPNLIKLSSWHKISLVQTTFSRIFVWNRVVLDCNHCNALASAALQMVSNFTSILLHLICSIVSWQNCTHWAMYGCVLARACFHHSLDQLNTWQYHLIIGKSWPGHLSVKCMATLFILRLWMTEFCDCLGVKTQIDYNYIDICYEELFISSSSDIWARPALAWYDKKSIVQFLFVSNR